MIDFVCKKNDDQVTVAVTVEGGDAGTGYLQLSFDETWEFHAEYFPPYIVNTSEWSIQCPLGFPELAGRHCEVYFWARFTGPKFRPGSKEPNRIYVDRVRVVPVGEEGGSRK